MYMHLARAICFFLYVCVCVYVWVCRHEGASGLTLCVWGCKKCLKHFVGVNIEMAGAEEGAIRKAKNT